MKFYLLLLYAVVGLSAFYYFTVLLHIFFSIFGENVSTDKSFIPFYGWIKSFRSDKKKKEEEEKEKAELQPEAKPTTKRKPRKQKEAK